MQNATIDPEDATISVVMIPDKAAVLENGWLIKTVEAHGVSVDSIIVNHVMDACDCDYCRRRAASQKSYIDEIKIKFGDKQIAHPPSHSEEVKGRWARSGGEGPLRKGAAEASAGPISAPQLHKKDRYLDAEGIAHRGSFWSGLPKGLPR